MSNPHVIIMNQGGILENVAHAVNQDQALEYAVGYYSSIENPGTCDRYDRDDDQCHIYELVVAAYELVTTMDDYIDNGFQVKCDTDGQE